VEGFYRKGARAKNKKFGLVVEAPLYYLAFEKCCCWMDHGHPLLAGTSEESA